MSFSTEIAKRSSNRFMLVRMQPAQYAVDELSLNGSIYEMTVNHVVSKVERNGTALTEDAIAPTVNDHYWFDETNNNLEIKLASAPDEDTNVIVVFYYIFITAEKTRRVPQDPETSTTTLRPWEPKLVNYPNFNESIRNVLNGVLSINSVNLKLINTDYFFNEMLKLDWSFYQKDIDIWLCVNDYSNRSKAFKGKIADVSLDQNNLNVSLFDPLNRLKQRALLDITDEAYYLKKASSYPDMNPNDDGKPIRLIAGRYTRYRTRPASFPLGTGTREGYDLFPNESFQAVCTDYSATPSGTDNRQWGLCRFLVDPIPGTPGVYTDYTLGTTTAMVIDGQTLEITTSGHEVRTGMGIIVYDATHQDTLRVFLVTATKIYAGRDSAFSYGGYTDYTVNGATDGITLRATAAMLMVKSDGTEKYLIEGDTNDGFNVFSTTTTDGNYYIDVQLASKYNSLTELDPGKDKLYYVAWPPYSGAKHEGVMQALLDGAGVDYNSASITAAGSALDAYVNFSIPYTTESDYGNYTKYIQDLLSSVFGYLSLNNAFEITYNLFTAPSSTTATTLDHILTNSWFINVNYQDIVDEIIFYNEDQVQDENSGDNLDNYEAVTSAKSRYLHEVTRTRKRRHLLEGATTRVTNIAKFIRNRYLSYKFKTASKDLDARIGDDVTLTDEFVIGTTATDNLKIISLSKDGSKTTIEATDLGDF